VTEAAACDVSEERVLEVGKSDGRGKRMERRERKAQQRSEQMCLDRNGDLLYPFHSYNAQTWRLFIGKPTAYSIQRSLDQLTDCGGSQRRGRMVRLG
jgi:hypothetical protein